MNDILLRKKCIIFIFITSITLVTSTVLIIVPWISFPSIHKIFIGNTPPAGSDSSAIFYSNVFTTFFTGFTALFTAINAGGLIYTLWLQRDSSDSQLQAIERQIETGEKQIKAVQDNASDTIFFDLFNNYKKEISALSITLPENIKLKGYDVIHHMASSRKTSDEPFGWKKNNEKAKFGKFYGFGGEKSEDFMKIAQRVHIEIAANYLFSICHKILMYNSSAKASEAKEVLRALMSRDEKYVLGNYRFIKYKMPNKRETPNIADEILRYPN